MFIYIYIYINTNYALQKMVPRIEKVIGSHPPINIYTNNYVHEYIHAPFLYWAATLGGLLIFLDLPSHELSVLGARD